MEEVKKKKFVKPELIKFDKPLDEVTLCYNGGSTYYKTDCYHCR